MEKELAVASLNFQNLWEDGNNQDPSALESYRTKLEITRGRVNFTLSLTRTASVTLLAVTFLCFVYVGGVLVESGELYGGDLVFAMAVSMSVCLSLSPCVCVCCVSLSLSASLPGRRQS